MKKGGVPISVEVIPEVITDLRTQKGLTKAALARLANMSAAHIVNIEKGKQKLISREAAKSLADVLGVFPERFAPDYPEKSNIPEPARAKDFLTQTDLTAIAEEYFSYSLVVARREAIRMGLDFGEAASIALFALWNAVRVHDHTRTRSLKAYITRAIKGELIREYHACRRNISFETLCEDGNGGLDYYDFIASEINIEEEHILREEVLEAVQNMTEDQRKNKRIRGLMKECGLIPIPA
ncbi:helix-turn-helix domain-containing protein [Anaerotruncus rubiinfantis]|uniref:helix-turn-helix domain-containing protein n=1 Tax=Anaerotruncus rubiinfantis TaxID=1720200 RepID=UPI001898FDA3|nr:helix-turn-helix domain-containing protein [Anaerotruncus rubiinfantis]